ncbi:TPA: hypothetical protein SAQ42_004011 [Klebsiella oxytoca]|uniref:hypothetical protein n=1 Tax=Klebsiella oxytoca TaxID=571 RepID=UPI00109334C8|nr:hypothetical protein [Klebsiella oxytoca]EJG2192158.1 hypothetical protein [Klebsiella oxytoca]EKU5184994.1 hypothetical protein [Klebsiella oxytoca]TGN43052.1 hypothetical protein E5Q62_18960 [Klebsiella oxytoca]WKM75065.1 hypothetical protein Q2T70_01670 [Klebsiella oxytoca]HEC2079990.1 hypothetical protein [Klebsiella oxytoca]
MPNKTIAMRKIREILRLRFEVGLSFHQISQCADVSTLVTEDKAHFAELAGVAGLSLSACVLEAMRETAKRQDR